MTWQVNTLNEFRFSTCLTVENWIDYLENHDPDFLTEEEYDFYGSNISGLTNPTIRPIDLSSWNYHVVCDGIPLKDDEHSDGPYLTFVLDYYRTNPSRCTNECKCALLYGVYAENKFFDVNAVPGALPAEDWNHTKYGRGRRLSAAEAERMIAICVAEDLSYRIRTRAELDEVVEERKKEARQTAEYGVLQRRFEPLIAKIYHYALGKLDGSSEYAGALVPKTIEEFEELFTFHWKTRSRETVCEKLFVECGTWSTVPNVPKISYFNSDVRLVDIYTIYSSKISDWITFELISDRVDEIYIRVVSD